MQDKIAVIGLGYVGLPVAVAPAEKFSGIIGFGVKPITHDPLTAPLQVKCEYGITISPLSKFNNLDALILAVPHAQYCKKAVNFPGMLRKGGIFSDIKSVVDRKLIPSDVRYWSP